MRAVVVRAAICLVTFLAAAMLSAADPVSVGKNPGKIEGRWLRVEDPSSLDGVKGVYFGEVVVDIQWKKAENEQPIDEELLVENIREQLGARLRETSALGSLLDAAPAAGEAGYIRLDCTLTVEPGSRAARYAVGFGAGKSRSIFEITLVDHASGAELGLFHGYGEGSGMGFKLAGGGARKMSEDDVQENSKEFVTLLAEVR
jgi:hypothetical protein